MKRLTCFAALAVALFAGSTASAATVEMSGNNSQIFTLNNVSDATLTFSVPTTAGYENFGGYVMWSTREDGLKDDAGNWGTCLECGYDGGSWELEYKPGESIQEIVRPRAVVNSGRGTDPSRPGRGNQVDVSRPSSTSDLFINFEGTRETVYLWVNPTYGRGSFSFEQTSGGEFPELSAPDFAETSATEISTVPLPAGAWLLITALGVISLMRRRKTG